MQNIFNFLFVKCYQEESPWSVGTQTRSNEWFIRPTCKVLRSVDMLGKKEQYSTHLRAARRIPEFLLKFSRAIMTNVPGVHESRGICGLSGGLWYDIFFQINVSYLFVVKCTNKVNKIDPHYLKH